MSNPDLPQDELAAVLEARRELGKEYEPALVEFVSPKTVDHHVSAILTKLGVRTRGEAARAAARLGING